LTGSSDCGCNIHVCKVRCCLTRSRLALLAISLGVAGLLLGCGGSSNNLPPSPLQITTQSPLPSARVNSPYTATLTATGGVPPYAWSGSNTPPGLVLSSVGVLAGTPSSAGNFVLTAADQERLQGLRMAGNALAPSFCNGEKQWQSESWSCAGFQHRRRWHADSCDATFYRDS
jgi:hypothetical protein